MRPPSLLVIVLAAACSSRPAPTSPAPRAPATAEVVTSAEARVSIERDRLIVIRGGETRELADVDDLPDLIGLDRLLAEADAGDSLTVELADDTIYADLRAVLKTATLHRLALRVGTVAVADSTELPASDIPMLAVSDAELAVGTYRASTPDPLVVSVAPTSDEAVAVAAVGVGGLKPAPTVVLVVIDPSTSGVVVNRVMRALDLHGIERAVFGARRG